MSNSRAVLNTYGTMGTYDLETARHDEETERVCWTSKNRYQMQPKLMSSLNGGSPVSSTTSTAPNISPDKPNSRFSLTCSKMLKSVPTKDDSQILPSGRMKTFPALETPMMPNSPGSAMSFDEPSIDEVSIDDDHLEADDKQTVQFCCYDGDMMERHHKMELREQEIFGHCTTRFDNFMDFCRVRQLQLSVKDKFNNYKTLINKKYNQPMSMSLDEFKEMFHGESILSKGKMLLPKPILKKSSFIAGNKVRKESDDNCLKTQDSKAKKVYFSPNYLVLYYPRSSPELDSTSFFGNRVKMPRKSSFSYL